MLVTTDKVRIKRHSVFLYLLLRERFLKLRFESLVVPLVLGSGSLHQVLN